MEMEEEEGGLKWKEMERDCLVQIFQKLSLHDLTLSIPFVCRAWFQASLSPLCWRVLDFRRIDFTPGSKFGKQFSVQYPPSSSSSCRLTFSAFMKFVVRRSCGAAAELHFPLFYDVPTEDLAYVSTGCPKLKVLGMDSLRPESELHFPGLVGNWKELEQLEMETGPSSSIADMAAAISLSCRNFRALSMSGEVRTEDALAVVEHFPKLKSLNLSRSYLPKHELLVIMDGCRELERLSAKYCVGFEADDEEVLRRACRIDFEHEGSKLREDFCCGASAGSVSSVVFASDDDCVGHYSQGL